MSTHIVVVEDDVQLQRTLRRVFESARYRVSTCGSAAEAIALLDADPAAMVLSDLDLGGQNGLSLLSEVEERWPATLRLIVTAAFDRALIDAIARCDVHRCVSKPWDDAGLLRLVAQLVAAFSPAAEAAHAG